MRRPVIVALVLVLVLTLVVWAFSYFVQPILSLEVNNALIYFFLALVAVISVLAGFPDIVDRLGGKKTPELIIQQEPHNQDNILQLVWKKYGVYLSIIGLIVVTITLSGIFGLNLKFQDNLNTNYDPFIITISENRFLLSLSAAIIILGFFALCYIIPQRITEGVYVNVSVSAYELTYEAGIQVIMASFACNAPAILLWSHIFIPEATILDDSMFIVVLTSSFVLLLLSLLILFDQVREKVNFFFVELISFLVIFVASVSATNNSLWRAIVTAVIASIFLLLYLEIMKRIPLWKVYVVRKKDTEKYVRNIFFKDKKW